MQTNWYKMASLKFSHKVYHISWSISKYFEYSSFVPTFSYLKGFWSISQEKFKSELQLCYSLILKIAKNHLGTQVKLYEIVT